MDNAIREKISLNGAQLKWIAMASMLLDHLNKGILLNYQIFFDSDNAVLNCLIDVFEILGRIAFPIFLFLLVEGYFHTRSVKGYLINLLVFGVLSEVPYDMFESGEFVDWGGQNMFFTLALALITIWAIDELRVRTTKAGLWLVSSLLIMSAAAFLASYLGLDYHYYGIIIPVIMYFMHDRRVMALLLSYISVIKELWSILGFVLCFLYNGRRGKINKWVGYLFYPVHLLIIGLIRMYVLKV